MLMTYKVLLGRDFKNVIRNPLLIKSRIFQTIFISIYIAGAYYKFSGDYTNQISWHKYTGFFFFMSISMMIALAPVTLIFPT